MSVCARTRGLYVPVRVSRGDSQLSTSFRKDEPQRATTSLAPWSGILRIPTEFQSTRMNDDTSGEDDPEIITRGGGEESSKPLLSVLVSRLVAGVRSLQGSPNELWKAYALKFLDSYSYFSLSIIFTLFLSADFGFSDVHAGTGM